MDEINNQDQGLSKKERRMEKRALRDRDVVRAGRMKIAKKITVWAVVVLGALAVVFGIWKIWSTSKSELLVGKDFSQSFPDQGQTHIKDGEKHEAYNSSPPTSGPHWANPVRDGIYDKSQPDEGLVHSLEHGRVWISYKSSIPEAVKIKLKAIAKGHIKTILTVRDQNSADVALAAWTRLDTFNLGPDGAFDESRVLDFISRYTDKAPERGVSAMGGKEY